MLIETNFGLFLLENVSFLRTYHNLSKGIVDFRLKIDGEIVDIAQLVSNCHIKSAFSVDSFETVVILACWRLNRLFDRKRECDTAPTHQAFHSHFVLSGTI